MCRVATDPAEVLSEPGALDGKIGLSLSDRDYASDVQTGAWFHEAIAEAFQARAPRMRVIKALNLVAMESVDT